MRVRSLGFLTILFSISAFAQTPHSDQELCPSGSQLACHFSQSSVLCINIKGKNLSVTSSETIGYFKSLINPTNAKLGPNFAGYLPGILQISARDWITDSVLIDYTIGLKQRAPSNTDPNPKVTGKLIMRVDNKDAQPADLDCHSI